MLLGVTRTILIALLALAAGASAQESPSASRVDLAAGKDLNAIFSDDGRRFWVAGDEGFLAASTDGGKTWTERPTEASAAITDVVFRSKDSGFLVTGGSIFATDDSGYNWNEKSRLKAKDFAGASPEAYSVCFSTGDKAWLVGALSRNDRVVDGLLMSSDDAGATWKRQKSPVAAELMHADFIDEKRGWIVGAEGAVARTLNGGRSWVVLDSGTNAMLYRVYFRDVDHGWAVGARGTVLRTVNRGNTWTSVAPAAEPASKGAKKTGAPAPAYLNIGFVREEGWIVGRSGAVLRSDDGGATWMFEPPKTRKNLTGLVVRSEGVWAVGADGTFLRLR